MNTEQKQSTILSMSFWVWCSLLSFPLMLTSDVDTVENQSNLYFLLFQVVGLFQYSIVAVLTYTSRILDPRVRHDKLQLAIIAIIVLSFGLQLHGESGSILAGVAYTVLLLIEIVLLSLVWTMQADAVAKCLGGAAVVFLLFAITAVALFGWPEDRHVGGIHPNLFGSVLLLGFVFSQFREGPTMFIVRGVCLVLVAAVSSRFAVIGCLIALVVFEATFKPVSARLVVIAVLAGTCLLLFHQQINDALALNDPARNMNSGFTGREDQWRSAFEAITNSPFGAGFKRPPPDEAGHNGYLKLIVEFGILGGGLIIVAVVGITVLAVITAALESGEDDRLRRLASARAAGLSALAFASFFQPQIFNFGDVHGISFILLLFAPGPRYWRQLRLNDGPVQPSVSGQASDRLPLSGRGQMQV